MAETGPAPQTLQDYFNATLAHHRAGRLSEAEAGYRRVLAQVPDHTPSRYNLGLVLRSLGRTDEAIATWREAVARRPQEAYIHKAIGRARLSQGQYAAAAEAFEAALALQPEDPDALNCRGNAARFQGLTAESLPFYDRAIAADPGYAFAHVNRAHALSAIGDAVGAIEGFNRGLALDPAGSPEAHGARFAQQLRICDWSDYDRAVIDLPRRLAAGEPADQPFNLLVYADDPADQLAAARAYARTRAVVDTAPLWRGETYDHPRLRVAYVSSDFRSHAVGHLTAALFEHHDRERFEISGYALAPAADDDMRRRIAAAFPEFHDVSGLSEAEIAGRLRAAEVDIAVDLNGYTTYCQPGIFARRCAPVQANFLGYPGTLGAPFMDYVVADPVTIPPGAEAGFDEAVVRLPDAYQPNDPAIAAGEVPTRAAAGLPQDGVVFCSFNASFKIAPPVFQAWMRLLKAVPGSVLWLLSAASPVVDNLRAEAARCGVDPQRLVFAPKVPLAAHLARHRLADLFLDTAPYNAHTTASDALRMGLPIITCAGRTFASRVAASLLTAVGRPDLVTTTLADYEALALDLARAPERLAAIRADLDARAPGSPLFDIARFARNLERAYAAMAARSRQGLPPEGFDLN